MGQSHPARGGLLLRVATSSWRIYAHQNCSIYFKFLPVPAWEADCMMRYHLEYHQGFLC